MINNHVLDIYNTILSEYYKILKLNLNTMECDCIKNNINDNYIAEYRFVTAYGVYQDDIEMYKEIIDIDNLKNHFSETSDKLEIRYRIKWSGDDYKWTNLSMFRSSDYNENNEVILLFYKDIHEDYSDILRKQYELEQSSYIDPLTGIYNRRAYSKTCMDVSVYLTVGVIFTDLNGLKWINDIKGHDAGDEYIKLFTNMLCGIFRHRECYRLGGDEFIVIAKDISRKQFMDKVNRLKNEIDKNNSLASIGATWSDDLNISVVDMITVAENFMKEDKNNYYENRSDIQRRF